MTHLHKTIFAAVAILFCVTVHAQSPDATKDAVKFEQVVPPDAWLVMGMDNVSATRERWSATPVGKWFQSDAVQALLKEQLEAQAKKTKARMQELGVEEDSWSWPESIGAGLYLAHDDTLDADLPHVLVSAVWGAGAGSGGKLGFDPIEFAVGFHNLGNM